MAEPVVTTQADLVASVARRWREQYPKGAEDPFGAIYRRLLKLKPTTAEEVDRIIGNTSWTRTTCDGCERSVPDVVQVGAEPDYKSSTAALCPACARAAVAALEARGL